MSPPYKTHDLLAHRSLSHGFFGRRGGVSKGQYASLNAGFGSNDAPQFVEANRERVRLSLRANAIFSLNQIHSRKVVVARKPFDNIPEADGIVTRQPNIAISALAADCAPVLFADIEAGVIGACHAGWRGALAGVTDETIETMTQQGAALGNISAVIGPCISQKNYEVGEAFRDDFIAEHASYDRFFTAGPTTGNTPAKPHFDLRGFILQRLKDAGLSRIAALPDCTYGQADEYFSYRYNSHNEISGYGRNISAIMLR